MPLLVPNQGERNALDMWLSDASPEAQRLRLYSNDVTPAEGDTASTYTEATIPGYSQVLLSRATWNAATTTGGVTSKTYPNATTSWNFTGTGVVVGYYVIRATTLDILWAERVFNSPGQTFNSGDSFTLTVRMQLE